MITAFRIPLVATPQFFDITLAGKAYSMVCRWNGEMPAWVLDIADATTATPLLFGLPIVTGVNLLAQYRHLEFGGGLIARTDGAGNPPPTETNLGTESYLYFVTKDAA